MEAQLFNLDQAVKAEIVQSLFDKLRACYIFPEIAEQICARLQQYVKAGEFTQITNGKEFSDKLTKHIQEVNHDEHLWVKWHPEPLPDEAEELRHNPVWQAERELEAALDNYGFYKVERLPGNVGYLDIRYLHRPAWAGDTAIAAMNFIAQTNALIIDLRYCTGGYPGMISLLCSYLFWEEPVHLTSIYWRDDDLTQQYWTLPYVPGKRFSDEPVYVLISEFTFSGGEAFASILQSHQRARLIGEKTDGGAHLGTSYRLHPHFELFIPIGRSINPATGTDWEGSGILPDIQVPEEQAFNIAYRLALESIVAELGAEPEQPYHTILDEARIALKGIAS